VFHIVNCDAGSQQCKGNTFLHFNENKWLAKRTIMLCYMNVAYLIYIYMI